VRVAALYDIHGNLHALEAVLTELEELQPDLVVIGGDVAAGPFPRETTDLVMNLPFSTRFVMGNGDRELIQAFHEGGPGPDSGPAAATTHWCVQRLTPEHIELFETFEREAIVTVPTEGALYFCHGSPRSDEDIITSATPTARIKEMLEGVTAETVVCGHTHMQFDRKMGRTRLVNAGSVGMPYARAPGAYWATLGETVDLRRTEYDLEKAAEAIRNTGWPMAKEFAAENVLTVPSPEEVIAIFEPVDAEKMIVLE
jgi:putative phosphoesterase